MSCSLALLFLPLDIKIKSLRAYCHSWIKATTSSLLTVKLPFLSSVHGLWNPPWTPFLLTTYSQKVRRSFENLTSWMLCSHPVFFLSCLNIIGSLHFHSMILCPYAFTPSTELFTKTSLCIMCQCSFCSNSTSLKHPNRKKCLWYSCSLVTLEEI